MKRTLRLVSLCAAIMLIFSFAGCKGSSSKKVESYSKFSDDIDLKGRTITVAMPYSAFIPVEDLVTTDEYIKHFNKVMIDRQKEAEKKYNCKIQWKEMTKDEEKKMLSNMKVGTNYGDIVYTGLNYGSLDMVRENLIEPLDQYIDYNSGVYSSSQQSAALWKGKHYGIAEKRSYTSYLSYNKTMISKEGLPDPYELMQKGQWTWEAFLDIAKKTTKDTNGDGVIDCWGVDAVYTLLYPGIIYSNDGEYIIDDNGEYRLVLGSDKAKEALQFVTDLYKTNKVAYDSLLSNDNNTKLFESNKAAFSFTHNVKDCDFEEGKVCMPKGPSATEYISSVPAGSFYAIPSNVEDIKSVACVMAGLFSYNDTTKDEYFDFYEFIKEQYPNDLFKNISENAKYSWFIENTEYRDKFNRIYLDILNNNVSVDNAINAQVAELMKKINELNQQYQ